MPAFSVSIFFHNGTRWKHMVTVNNASMRPVQEFRGYGATQAFEKSAFGAPRLNKVEKSCHKQHLKKAFVQ